jgi:hypothetical protein
MFRFLENHHQGGHTTALFKITSMRSSNSTRHAVHHLYSCYLQCHLGAPYVKMRIKWINIKTVKHVMHYQ